MAYSNFNPYVSYGQAYTPNYNQPAYQQLPLPNNPVQQTVQPQMPSQTFQNAPQPMDNTNSGMIWVHENEVNNYLVAPNSVVTLWDIDKPVIYKKSADASGKPSVEAYDLVKREPNQPAVQHVPAERYALETDVQALMKRIDELEKLCREGA